MTYQDSGKVTILTKVSKGSPALLFHTYFARPRSFLFEWTETIDMPESELGQSFAARLREPGGPERVYRLKGISRIWSNPHGVFEWYDKTLYRRERGKVTRVKDLDSAISGAQGVSLRSASAIISLLSAQKLTYGFPTVKQPRFLEERSLNGTKCYRIAGVAFNEPIEVWIEKGDLLVRKIGTGKPGSIIEEIISTVHVNEAIPEKQFDPAHARPIGPK